MGNSALGTGIFLLIMTLPVSFVQADGTAPHIGKDEAFSSVREIMPQFATLQQEIGDALQARNPDAISVAVNRLAGLVPIIKYGPAHRNLDRLKTMGRVADPFRSNVEEVARQVRYANYSGAEEAFRAAREGCTTCHAQVRELP